MIYKKTNELRAEIPDIFVKDYVNVYKIYVSAKVYYSLKINDTLCQDILDKFNITEVSFINIGTVFESSTFYIPPKIKTDILEDEVYFIRD